jgi:hypothetical protein
MAMHELKRTHYEDVGDATIRHDTRDHRQDMTHYHVPVMHMHQAQKVLQPDKAMGAIIGKALGRLDAGQGKIPVLVLLQ